MPKRERGRSFIWRRRAKVEDFSGDEIKLKETGEIRPVTENR